MGWICRRCSNGDHEACEEEVRGLYCVCVEAQCNTVEELYPENLEGLRRALTAHHPVFWKAPMTEP